MFINKQEYLELESIFRQEVNRFQPLLVSDDMDEIEHYLTHAEIEMAFELLGLSLMQNKIVPTPQSSEKLLRLGLRLNLDKESIFDDNFWTNFTRFLHNKNAT